MRGVHAFDHLLRDGRCRRGVCAIDRVEETARVRLARELRGRHRIEVRIGEFAVAIDEGALIRTAEQVQIRHAAERRHVWFLLDDVHRLGHRHAAR